MTDLREYLLECRFVLDDLGAVDDETLAARPLNPYAKLTLMAFKYGRSPDLLEYFTRYQSEIRTLLATESGDVLWFELLRYTWHVNAHVDSDELIAHLRPIVGQKASNTMMTIAQKLEHRGFEKGIGQGIGQGQRNVLLRFLERRFAVIPAEVAKRVAQATNQQVEHWLPVFALLQFIK